MKSWSAIILTKLLVHRNFLPLVLTDGYNYLVCGSMAGLFKAGLR